VSYLCSPTPWLNSLAGKYPVTNKQTSYAKPNRS
jgi:hypothetical protein